MAVVSLPAMVSSSHSAYNSGSEYPTPVSGSFALKSQWKKSFRTSASGLGFSSRSRCLAVRLVRQSSTNSVHFSTAGGVTTARSRSSPRGFSQIHNEPKGEHAIFKLSVQSAKSGVGYTYRVYELHESNHELWDMAQLAIWLFHVETLAEAQIAKDIENQVSDLISHID